MAKYDEIISEVRRSKPQAQMAFYDMFAQTTFRSALAVVGNSDEAEEIMQDCILKTLTNIDLLRDDAAAMKNLLCRMAVNLAIDTVRKRKNLFVDVEGQLEDLDCEDDEPETEMPDIEDIKEGVNSLPDTYRSVIALRLFDEMSFDEISKALEINASTVRVQYTRGITKLKMYLKQKNDKNERYA
ncbi:MAG: RNA polymerase sigma factor [Tannerella sp.]|jgi:RNA polymerase sigma-70 factor (ECF subfamily)|nr:RNA polymerase sigma factor [Tannerella sp.]